MDFVVEAIEWWERVKYCVIILFGCIAMNLTTGYIYVINFMAVASLYGMEFCITKPI